MYKIWSRLTRREIKKLPFGGGIGNAVCHPTATPRGSVSARLILVSGFYGLLMSAQAETIRLPNGSYIDALTQQEVIPIPILPTPTPAPLKSDSVATPATPVESAPDHVVVPPFGTSEPGVTRPKHPVTPGLIQLPKPRDLLHGDSPPETHRPSRSPPLEIIRPESTPRITTDFPPAGVAPPPSPSGRVVRLAPGTEVPEVEMVSLDSPALDGGTADPVDLVGKGLLKMKQGDPFRASDYFRRAVQADPGNDRARLELAEACYRAGKFEEATRYFNEVLANDPPPAVARNVNRFLDRIYNRPSIPTGFTTRLHVGAFSDDNINVGPSDASIEISPVQIGDAIIDSVDVAEDAQPGDTRGLSLGLDISWVEDIGEVGGWQGVAQLAYGETLLEDLEEFETQIGTLSLGIRRPQSSGLLDLPVTFRDIRLDRDELIRSVGLVPSYVHGISKIQSLTSLGKLERRDYAIHDRDSVYGELSEVYTHQWSDNGPVFSLGLAVFAENAESDSYSYLGWRARAGSSVPLHPQNRLVAYLAATYGEKRYDELEVLAPGKRDDEFLQLGAGIRGSLLKNTILDLGYHYTDNQSSFGLYEYDKSRISLGLTQVF